MSLPEDVITEILSRIPATPLLRFKCVCKSWHNIINDPAFISKHHQTISAAPESEAVMISRRSNATNRRVLSLLRSPDDVVDHDLPTFLNDMFGHVRLVGPCNGIVCLYGYYDNIALWNPAIRCFKKLPASQLPRPSNFKVRGGDLGVGFDPKTRDIKVLQILFCVSMDSQIVYQVEIYSSRMNSWKKLESSMPANIMCYNLWSMVYKNENFCWWAQDKNNVEVILSFNMVDEAFEMTQLPSDIEPLGGQHRTTRAIMPLKESLALIVYRQLEDDKVFDVWILNEIGGGVEAWSKLTRIGPISGVEKVLGFWNKCECILESRTGETVLYNRVTRKTKNLGIYGKRSRLEVLVLTESLYSVN
ncbi:F-box/kelch-repeat protein At3g23880-like [Salvia miltiorrhiza]|uniref:F-box/kelch-repeat protein At3g23880-like n=1 Tax=Salvia miltiorrhiza TaxID=226208 RepID=UPI0025ABEA74|nr:F-box/kelch-repeat protein At3g23880-like [Salvia miltiorrhiza]